MEALKSGSTGISCIKVYKRYWRRSSYLHLRHGLGLVHVSMVCMRETWDPRMRWVIKAFFAFN